MDLAHLRNPQYICTALVASIKNGYPVSTPCHPAAADSPLKNIHLIKKKACSIQLELATNTAYNEQDNLSFHSSTLYVCLMKSRAGLFFLMLILVALIPPVIKAETRILFLGDSITAGYGIDKEKAYPELVHQALLKKGFRDIKIINAGISGSTTASAMSRLKWYARIEPHILVLALGGNDGLRGISIQAMSDNLENSIRYALEKDMKVVLAGMQMPPNYGQQYTTAFRNVYYRLAKRYVVTFMPFLLKDVGGKPDLNLPDGIHPTPEGHKLIAGNILPYILENL